MSTVKIDIDASNNIIILTGDISELCNHRFALRYMKDFLHPTFFQDNISIPIGDAEPNKILSNIRAMLQKYGFTENHSDSSNKVLQDFYEDERKFEVFSDKALRIHNNDCEPDEFRIFTDIVANNLPARSLYPLQLLCAFHLAFSQNACNFSVPGSGKTSIVYGAYIFLKSLSVEDPKHVDKILIVGPLSAFGPWELEYKECFGRAPSVKRLISGLNREEKIDYLYSRNAAEITLISYASLTSLIDAIKFFLKYNKVMVVLDEAHKIKNTSGGITAQSVLDIAKYCSSRVVLTGTPAPNGYQDLFNIFKFIWPNKNIVGYEINQLRDMTTQTYDARIPNMIGNISPYFMRIKKSDLGIPVATIHPPQYVEMGPVQRKIYDFIERKYIESMIDATNINISNGFRSVLLRAKMIRLMQAATDPEMLMNPLNEYLDDEDQPYEAYNAVNDAGVLSEILSYSTREIPIKYIQVKNIVERIISVGGKVVIWAIFIHTIHKLKDYLAKNGILAETLYGAVPIEQDDLNEESDINIMTRERIIREFHKPDCPYKVIIANPFAVAESISLHKACHNAIYIERSFNASHFVQSKDRIHRYGLKSTDTTNYYFLISKDSVDETINKRLIEKENRMTEVMESMPIPLFENNDEDLGNDDIKALIRDYVRRTKRTQTT